MKEKTSEDLKDNRPSLDDVMPQKDTNPVIAILESHEDIIGDVSGMWKELIGGMSAYQIRTFVLNKVEYPTPDSVYKQCLTELWTRYQGLLDLIKQYADNQAKQKLTDARRRKFESLAKRPEGSTPQSPDHILAECDINLAKAQLAQNQLEHLRRQVPLIIHSAKETMREMLVYYEAFEEAKNNRRYDTIEAAQRGDWMARSAMRIRYGGGKGIPPYTGSDQMKLKDLQQKHEAGMVDDQLIEEAVGILVVKPNQPQVLNFGKHREDGDTGGR